MKKILKYCIIYIFILMSIQYVSAINASNYDFNYGDLNTIGCAQNAANSQNEIGYTPTPFSDSVASSAFARMTNDNIFFFNGHGNSGLLRFANDSGDFSYITAKNMAYPYISSYSNHELDDLLLAVYVSCHSGTDNVVWGNLLDESVKSGVDTALGFHGLIKSPTSSTWSNKFWENIQNGYTVADAAHDATDTVSYWNGIYVDPQGLENWTIKGSAFVNVSLQKTGVIEDNGNLANRPAASYTVSRTSNPLDVRYQFTDTSTNSPTKFYWYFDDGTSSNETNPSHGFPSDGYYTITHTATNQYGTGRGAQSQYLLHSNLPIPSGPLDANFLPTAYNGMAPLTVRFIDLSPGNPTSWRWNFGFDYYSSSIEQNPVYTYTRERDMPYTVDLTVKDSGGNLVVPDN